jgi:Peroxisomal biogenesis factor 11 (PEX11)
MGSAKPNNYQRIATLFLRISRVWWLIGVSMYLVYCVKTLRKTYTDESDLKVAALNKMTVRELKENLRIISELRTDYWLNFNRALSDLFLCLNENDLPFLVVGIRLNKGTMGFFGMASSLIYLYSLLKYKS